MEEIMILTLLIFLIPEHCWLLVQCTLSMTQSWSLCPSKIILVIQLTCIAVSADSQVGGCHFVWFYLGYLESGGQLCGSVLGICDRHHRESHAEARSVWIPSRCVGAQGMYWIEILCSGTDFFLYLMLTEECFNSIGSL